MEVVTIDHKLVFLETRVTKIIIPRVGIPDLITIYKIACKVIRRVKFIGSPSIMGRIRMSMEIRVECNAREDLRIVQILHFSHV